MDSGLTIEKVPDAAPAVTESFTMPEEPYRYDLRNRVEAINERVVRSEGRQEGHEAVCAQRYAQILKDVAEMRIEMANQSKYGLAIAAVLALIELGRATFPALFDILTKGAH